MTQPSPVNALEVLSEALLQAWRGRSPLERDAFAIRIGVAGDQTATNPLSRSTADDAESQTQELRDHPVYPRYPTSPKPHGDGTAGNEERVPITRVDWPEPDIAEVARSFERLAAVSGAIDPQQLRLGRGGPLAEIALDRIAPSFDRTRTPGGWAWTLRSDRRATVLGTMPKPVLMDELGRAAGVATDAAGEAFRVLLRNGALKRGEASPDAEVMAHSWLDLVEPTKRDETRALRLRNARSHILGTFDHLLSEGFVGRRHDIDRLRAFAENPQATSQILSVTGIGGVGKSTLLAAALRPVIERSFEDARAPVVISIDFDRRAHATGAELEMSFELSRQLELFHPGIGDELEAVREAVTRERIVRGELNRQVFDSQGDSVERHSFEFQNRAAPIMKRVGVGKRPLLLIVDTFEEWQRSRFGRWDAEHPMRRFLGWLAEIEAAWRLQVRVIVSGRTPVRPDSSFASGGVIALGDLNRAEAVSLLRQRGLSEREARALARMTGGNPLALKLAARYHERLPSSARSAFLDEGARELEGLDATLRQGVLYRRFLDHIADPQARKLAHPGLALRRVTAELIQHVLAGPCQLGPLDLAGAEELLERLAREIWLVESRWPVITHRPEPRRVMLQAMKSDPLQRSKIQAVHLAALRWYEQGDDRSEDDEAEALYHRLSLGGDMAARVDIAAIPPRILQRVAQSANDFDIGVRAELLFRAGRQVSITEAQALPPRERQVWAQDKAASLVRSGQPERALAVWKQLGESAPSSNWYAAAAFQALDWPQIALPFEASPASRDDSLRYDFLLSFAMQERQPDMVARYRHWLGQTLAHQIEKAQAEDGNFTVALEGLYFENIVDPSAALVHRRRMQPVTPDQDLDASSQQYIRLHRLLRGSLYIPSIKRLRPVLSSLFCPSLEFVELICVRCYRAGYKVESLARFLDEFSQALSMGLSSDQLLGHWADLFANAVSSDLGQGRPDRDFAIAILDELRSDDPEWRVPIRAALVEAARDRENGERLARVVSDVLGVAAPMDLTPPALIEATRRSGRKAWGRATEYLDRLDRLGAFMERCREVGDDRLREVAHLYVRWDRLRRQSGM